jgi:hypothetical protein
VVTFLAGFGAGFTVGVIVGSVGLVLWVVWKVL